MNDSDFDYDLLVIGTGPGGELWHALDLGAVPAGAGTVAMQPGLTWHFQAWYRDGGTSNFSDGLEVAFEGP